MVYEIHKYILQKYSYKNQTLKKAIQIPHRQPQEKTRKKTIYYDRVYYGRIWMCQCVIYRGTCFLWRLSWPHKTQPGWVGLAVGRWKLSGGPSTAPNSLASIESGKNKRSPLDWDADARMTLHTPYIVIFTTFPHRSLAFFVCPQSLWCLGYMSNILLWQVFLIYPSKMFKCRYFHRKCSFILWLR